MTEDDLIALFEKHSDEEYIQHDRIEPDRRLHRRPDINAFLLLDRLAEGSNELRPDVDMVSGAEHDEFYLYVAPEDILGTTTEEDVIDLIRCGVRYDPSRDCFAMFA